MNTKTKLNPNFNPRKRIDSFKKDFFDRGSFFFLTLPLCVNLFNHHVIWKYCNSDFCSLDNILFFFIIQVSILKFKT